MGISPQQFRIKIGIFQQKDLTNGKSKVKKQSVRFDTKKTKFRLFFTLLVLLALCHLENKSNQNSELTSLTNYKTFGRNSSHLVNHNFWAKVTYGNRRSNGIKLCQWNAGAGHLRNKINEIVNIISGYKPHVLGISESCFKEDHSID